MANRPIEPMSPPAPLTTSSRSVAIDDHSDGQRLDNFLLRELKGVPKSHIYRIIRSGEVRINKGRCKPESKLQAGDTVRIPPIRTAERSDVAAEGQLEAHAAAGRIPSAEFEVLYEDTGLLAINKPAGLAVHGGSGVSYGVIEQLRASRPDAAFLELVHRLDKETSGLLLIAKKRSALLHVQEQFKNRETHKVYLALVLGEWQANKKVVDVPLLKYLDAQGERRVRVATEAEVAAGSGKRSITLVRRLSVALLPSGMAVSLLHLTLKTGRTHQLRVHLASNGCPIVGDEKYGDFVVNKMLAKPSGSGSNANKFAFNRMYLHAWRMEVDAPVLAAAPFMPAAASTAKPLSPRARALQSATAKTQRQDTTPLSLEASLDTRFASTLAALGLTPV